MIDWQLRADKAKIGLAIRYHDHILGNIWIWGGILDKYEHYPSAKAFKYQHITESVFNGPIAKHLYRLQSAGLLSIQDRIMVLVDFSFEVDTIKKVKRC